MPPESVIERILQEYATHPAMVTEALLMDVFREIHRQMREQGITQQELADRLGVNQPRVSRMLKPRENITLETMGRIAAALGCQWENIRLTLQPLQEITTASPKNPRKTVSKSRRPKRRDASSGTEKAA